ncbi:hypothetical protein WJX72_010048 [[Myrmecia] bisecta]|uniref:EF-hand domain-containing protein n=1 Tax=[Myrmecia] bisecta TaxID=41462 RepID=A0AAW1R9E8_9CHLO
MVAKAKTKATTRKAATAATSTFEYVPPATESPVPETRPVISCRVCNAQLPRLQVELDEMHKNPTLRQIKLAIQRQHQNYLHNVLLYKDKVHPDHLIADNTDGSDSITVADLLPLSPPTAAPTSTQATAQPSGAAAPEGPVLKLFYSLEHPPSDDPILLVESPVVESGMLSGIVADSNRRRTASSVGSGRHWRESSGSRRSSISLLAYHVIRRMVVLAANVSLCNACGIARQFTLQKQGTTRQIPEDLDSVIDNPGLPRANSTVTREFPQGYDDSSIQRVKSSKSRTVMMQHVDFFDADGDGIIYPKDTYEGFLKMGLPWVVAFFSPLAIHGAMSLPTVPGFLPDWRFPIYTDRIHKAKHGSDSQVYDNEGRFVPSKFEEIFTKFDRGNKGGLTWKELNEFVSHNKNLYDAFGSSAAWAEWGVTWLLAAEGPSGQKLLSKESIRGQFDGSLFYQKAEARAAKKAAGR